MIFVQKLLKKWIREEGLQLNSGLISHANQQIIYQKFWLLNSYTVFKIIYYQRIILLFIFSNINYILYNWLL